MLWRIENEYVGIQLPLWRFAKERDIEMPPYQSPSQVDKEAAEAEMKKKEEAIQVPIMAEHFILKTLWIFKG